jgi:uncharacterized membrane protein/uncharacterized protein YaaQ
MSEESEGRAPQGQEEEVQTDRSKSKQDRQEPVWTFRGYKLSPSEFTTAMVHLFRAEVSRANVWRTRLDATTNWAVITTGAVMSFAFSDVRSHHLVIMLDILLVTFLLWIESRRYRYYELWSYRVRLMETDFFASMLVPPFHPSPEWSEALAENLLHPSHTISNLEAMGRRLRRNYLWIYLVIILAWFTKIWAQPTPVRTLAELINRAEVGTLPGEAVFLLVLAFVLFLLGFSVLTAGLKEASGEILPRYGSFAESILPHYGAGAEPATEEKAWFRPTRRRKQLITFIITDRYQEVTERILKDMNRGVTALSGTGMFTGQAHAVLMCALTLTEVPHLKHLVSEVDPKAFVIVSPAQEIFGSGFMPLEEED